VHVTDTSLSGTIDADRAGTVFLSVPAIKGWGTVKVDGKSVSPTILASAFLGIPVTAGHHTISMSFSPPGLRLGAGLTVVGLLMLFGLYKRDQRGRGHDATGGGRGGRFRMLLPGTHGMAVPVSTAANVTVVEPVGEPAGELVPDDGTVLVAGVPLPRFVLPDETVAPVAADEGKEMQA
jgi:hypothetical protein